MFLPSSFQEVSSRSFSFFCRSLGATRKCFQHLSLGQKRASDMVSLTDADVIEFYTKDKLREERKTSLHGEVPDCFRTNNFFLSIEGQNWAHARDWKESYTSAKVYLRNKDSEAFQQVLRTEIIAGDRHPRFTGRVHFSPLRMTNSQNHAMNTTVRIDAFFKETRFASIHVNLAQLLWNMTYETRIESRRPSIVALDPRNMGKIKLNVLKGRSVEDVDDCEVLFKIQMKRSVWTQARESKLFISVSSVAGYGQWSRSYVTELLFTPTKTMGSGRFLSFKLNRGDLVGSNQQNPVRIEILGTKKGVSIGHGFIQLALSCTSRKCYVSWNQARASYLSANVVLHTTFSSPNHLAMSLYIGADDDTTEDFTIIERSENRTGGNGKYSRNSDAVASQITQSYDSSGSSSGSSDLSVLSSVDKKRGKAHPSGPQYHVRFPTLS